MTSFLANGLKQWIIANFHGLWTVSSLIKLIKQFQFWRVTPELLTWKKNLWNFPICKFCSNYTSFHFCTTSLGQLSKFLFLMSSRKHPFFLTYPRFFFHPNRELSSAQKLPLILGGIKNFSAFCPIYQSFPPLHTGQKPKSFHETNKSRNWN